jgi:hypothetical protein
MGLSASTVAYGTVIVAGLVLFAIGTPAERGRELALAPTQTTATAQTAATPSPVPARTSVSGGGITLQSVSLDFPTSDRMFPGGSSADAINNNCLACHSAGMVLTQPAMPRAAWSDEVNKMRNTYKAPVAAEDVPAIVAYLATQKGTD